jgi:hypothetical protein
VSREAVARDGQYQLFHVEQLCELAQVLVGICEEINIENTIVDPFRDDCMRFAQASQGGLIRCKFAVNKMRI